MRLKKGTKVEVFTQREVPPGSWRYGEIIDGDGRYYNVKYDDYDVGNFGKVVVEKVSHKTIRPCPPRVDVLDDWVCGDVIEVFHNFSWKMATVLKVSGRDHIVVRLLGSEIKFKTNRCNVRARVCWQDGEWMVIGKASGKSDDLRFRVPSSRTDYNHSQKTSTKVGPRVIPLTTLKRKPSNCQEENEAHAERPKKVRAGEKHNTQLHFNVVQQPQIPKKVENVANYDVENSVASSVGSCSINGNYSHTLHHIFKISPSTNNENEFSDAESFCHLEIKEGNGILNPKEEVPEEIHRLELHAYRCIIEALHASGPLSWELELLLTNLRDSLHISVDEHLMEIRNLVSSS